MPKRQLVPHSRRGGAEREHMRIRRALMLLVRDAIEREGLAYSRLALMLGTSESRAWNLIHGPVEQFNSETLIDVLKRLGVTIDVTVTKCVTSHYWDYVPKR